MPRAARRKATVGAWPTALFMFERGQWTSHAPAAWASRSSGSLRWTPWTSSVLRAEQPVPPEALDEAGAVPFPAVLHVRAVLGHVDVEAGVLVPHDPCQPVEALVRQREARVSADQAAGQRGRPARQEGPVLLDPGVAAGETVAVGRLVAEHGAQPHLLDRSSQRRERSPDERGRGVVVEEERSSRSERPRSLRRGRTGRPTPRRARGRAATTPSPGSRRSSAGARPDRACRARGRCRGGCGR